MMMIIVYWYLFTTMYTREYIHTGEKRDSEGRSDLACPWSNQSESLNLPVPP